jgi:hypothetical protein
MAARGNETIQENIQDEGDPGFQFLAKKKLLQWYFFIYFHQHYIHYYIFHLHIYSLSFLSFTAIIFFINADYWLIRITSPSINLD